MTSTNTHDRWRQVYGRDLQVGQVMEVWWKAKRDLITDLRPYTGNLASIFPEGAQIAEFATLPTGMTIDNSELYNVLVTKGTKWHGSGTR